MPKNIPKFNLALPSDLKEQLEVIADEPNDAGIKYTMTQHIQIAVRQYIARLEKFREARKRA